MDFAIGDVRFWVNLMKCCHVFFFQVMVGVGYLQDYSFYVRSKLMCMKFFTLCCEIMCNLYNLQGLLNF